MGASSISGSELQLVPPADRREAIMHACARCWFEKNPSGKMNWGDCSGFVKSVQRELLLTPFEGTASAIAATEIYARTDWKVLGIGPSAIRAASREVDAGRLVIAGWAAPAGQHGHVMVVTMQASFLGSTPEQQLYGSWGTIGSVGATFGRLSKSFGSAKHPAIVYAACNSMIVPVW